MIEDWLDWIFDDDDRIGTRGDPILPNVWILDLDNLATMIDLDLILDLDMTMIDLDMTIMSDLVTMIDLDMTMSLIQYQYWNTGGEAIVFAQQ